MPSRRTAKIRTKDAMKSTLNFTIDYGLPDSINFEELDLWLKKLKDTGLDEPTIARILMSRIRYGSSGKNLKPKGVKKGMTDAEEAFAMRNETGEMEMFLPAGMPPDQVNRYTAGFNQMKAKDDIRRRLQRKLDAKHAKHTGDECDECFWKKSANPTPAGNGEGAE